MQTLYIASVEDTGNGEQTSGKSTFASGPINIASVRASSLRSSGLRAASSRRGSDTLKEKQSALTAMNASEPRCLSSSLSMPSTTHLSYTNSQEPGEDSQLNALAMVDKLLNLNAPIWQKPESSLVAEHSCAKGPHINKGMQSLARHADMQNLQEKMGIYDWIDSQPDGHGHLEQVSPTLKAHQEQLEVGMPIKNRPLCQGMVSSLAGANDTRNALDMQKPDEDPNKLHDIDASDKKVEAEMVDIGANTQIALEAMDILRCGFELDHQSAPVNEKACFALSDVETASKDKRDIMANDERASHSEKAKSSLRGIGNDTQSAIDAIDTMRQGIPVDISVSKVKATSSLVVDIGNDTQTALDAIEIMRHGNKTDRLLPNANTPSSVFDIGNDTQTAIEAMDIMRHGIETYPGVSNVESCEKTEQHLRAADAQKHATFKAKSHAKRKLSPLPSTLGRKGRLLSKASGVSKLVRKKGASREVSKSQRSGLFSAPAGPVYNSSNRFLPDFSSAMVPRRKRSRLRSPRSTLHENLEAFGCQEHDFHLHKPLTKADRQTQPGKPTSFESQKSAVWPKQDHNSPERAVLTESTNGESIRRTKKRILTESDSHALLDQSRKRRKCESRCIFVLFSHSLSEVTIKQQKRILMKLGGHITTVAAKATHFVADSFARSRNMLEIMAAGKVVVTTMWLEGCSQSEYFVDEDSYILQDVQKEKQWGFCMHSSLAASRRKPLFKGMKVMVSPTTAPDFEAIKAVIECAGGQAMQKLPSSSHSKADEIACLSFVVGSEKDYDFCVEFLKRGCKVYSAELVLHGVVTQCLDFSRNRLFEDYIA